VSLYICQSFTLLVRCSHDRVKLSDYTFFHSTSPIRPLHSFPTRRSSDLSPHLPEGCRPSHLRTRFLRCRLRPGACLPVPPQTERSEEHTSELQSRFDLVCRLLLEKKINK